MFSFSFLKIIININLKQANIKKKNKTKKKTKLETKLHLDNLCRSSKPISISDGFSDPPSTKIFNLTE